MSSSPPGEQIPPSGGPVAAVAGDAPTGDGRTGGLLRDRGFVAALAVAFVVALGFGLIIPVLPRFARSFGVGLFAVSGVVAAFAGARLVSNLFAGRLSDRIGTHRAVAGGAVVVAVSSLLSAAATSYWQLLAYRGAGGIGSALFFTALLSHVVRIVPPDQRGRAMGMLQGAFLVGTAFGPSIGGVLAGLLGFRLPFAVYAVFCAAAGAIAYFMLPRAARDGGPDVVTPAVPAGEGDVVPTGASEEVLARSGTWRVARTLLSDGTFVVALLLMCSSRWAATGIRFSLVPVFAAEVLDASDTIIGVALTLAAVAHLVVLPVAGRVSDRLGRRVLAGPAYLAYAAAAAALAFVGNVPAFIVVLAVYGFATGLSSITPSAIVADVVPKSVTGVGVGLLNTASDVGAVLGPLVSGFLVDAFGYSVGFGSSALFLAVAGLVALRMRETAPSVARAAPQ